MKKVLNGIDLTLEVNEDCEQMARSVMNGALNFNKSGTKATFVEAAPRRAHTRNTKVWDGELLSMILKPNGVYQVHTKNVNPLAVDNFEMRMYNEACALVLLIRDAKVASRN